MLKKYRKRPIVIEATQWPNAKEKPPIPDEYLKEGDLTGRWCIRTLEGVHVLNDGDWIIKGVAGEYYPCKPDIFAKTYEEVDDAP